jgi:hypothetical protein
LAKTEELKTMDNYSDAEKKAVNEIRSLLNLGKSRDEILARLSYMGLPSSYAIELFDFTLKQDESLKQEYTAPSPKSNRFQNVPSIERSAVKSAVKSASNQSFSQAQLQRASTLGIKRHSSKLLLFMLLFFIAAIFAAALILFPTNGKKDPFVQGIPVDYELQIISPKIASGEELILSARISKRPQAPAGADEVILLYRLISPNQDIIDEWTYTKQVEFIEEFRVVRQVSSNLPPGRYKVYSEVTSNNVKTFADSALFFDISKPLAQSPSESPSETQPASNTKSPSDIQSPSDVENKDSPSINSVQGDKGHQLDEQDDDADLDVIKQSEERENILSQIEDAKSLSGSEPKTAALVCLNITDSGFRQNCFHQAAKHSKNYAFCEQIADISAKDFCYLNYILDTGDYTKCGLLNKARTKESCYQMDPLYRGATA